VRVLHLSKTSEGAGWLLRQVRELTKLGVEVHAAMPPGGRHFAEYQESIAAVHPMELGMLQGNPLRSLGLLKELRRLVREVKPDIIHSHFVATTLAMRLALGRRHHIPRLFQVPGPLHLEHAVFRFMDLYTAGPPDYWIGSCRWIVDRYRRSGVVDGRVFLSYYGTDIDCFTAGEKGVLRRELRLDDKTKVVGMVAFMYRPRSYLGQKRGIKGHEDLIDALAVCAEKVPEIMGVFVGGAWGGAVEYWESVKQYGCEKLGDRAIFLGTRRDIERLYPDFDVAVHPSHTESVGAAGESLLMAVPTIAANVGGLPDLVRDGETGRLVPPCNPQRLAEAILATLADPKGSKEMALRGQALARTLFDVRRTVREVYRIYNAVLAQDGRKSVEDSTSRSAGKRNGGD
jgi:glycosyltransferase involved in cell wall biosynthesis